MNELVRSFCGPDPAPSAVEVVFPTQAQVGQSLEGWFAGTSIPCDVTNAVRLRERLAEMPCGRLCVWDGGSAPVGGGRGRGLAVPHIKSFLRYDASDRTLAWALLGSHNLSQAAWGKLEKAGSQLYVKSYELGVLLTATTSAPLIAPSQVDAAATSGLPPGRVLVPLPYSLPPVRYTSNDVPWSTNDNGRLPHTQCNVRPECVQRGFARSPPPCVHAPPHLRSS